MCVTNCIYSYYIIAALHAERCKEAFSSSSLTSGSQPSVTGKSTSLLKQVQEEGTHMEYTPLYSESFEVASDDHEVASATAPGVSDVASRSKSQRVDTVNVVTASTLSERSFDPDSLQDPAEQSGTASTNSLSCISLINEGDEATTDVDQYSQTASVVQESPHKSDSHKGGKTAKTHLQTDTQPPVSTNIIVYISTTRQNKPCFVRTCQGMPGQYICHAYC